MRKSFACDECKRRKIRCSGGDRCTNCSRDSKQCRYSSPSQRLVSLQRCVRYTIILLQLQFILMNIFCRRLRESEESRLALQQLLQSHVPGIDLEAALRKQQEHSPAGESIDNGHNTQAQVLENVGSANDSIMEDALMSPVEPANAEEYEFDESKDIEGSIDGMGFLTADPHKAGYTGPQAGIAAFKFLQSLPPYLPTSHSSPLSSVDDVNIPQVSSLPAAAIKRYIDDYFSSYHPAYPILHEGTFRARYSGWSLWISA